MCKGVPWACTMGPLVGAIVKAKAKGFKCPKKMSKWIVISVKSCLGRHKAIVCSADVVIGLSILLFKCKAAIAKCGKSMKAIAYHLISGIFGDFGGMTAFGGLLFVIFAALKGVT